MGAGVVRLWILRVDLTKEVYSLEPKDWLLPEQVERVTQAR